MQPGERRGVGRFPCYCRGRCVRRRGWLGRRTAVTRLVNAGRRRRVPSQELSGVIAVRRRQQHRSDGLVADQHGLLSNGGRSELPPPSFHHSVPIQSPRQPEKTAT